MSSDDEGKQGIITKFSMKFDKNDKLLSMTKMQIVKQLYDMMVHSANNDEDLKNQAITNNTQDDQIKAFNKKLANAKADQMTMLDVQKKDMTDEMARMQKSIREFESKLTANLEKLGGGEIASEPSLDRIGIGQYED